MARTTRYVWGMNLASGKSGDFRRKGSRLIILIQNSFPDQIDSSANFYSCRRVLKVAQVESPGYWLLKIG